MDENRYFEEDFSNFLIQIINDNRLDSSKEIGIVKLAVEKDFESLSDKQKYVLKKAISNMLYEKCDLCTIDIPWSEMTNAEENGGFCSSCWHTMNKND